MTTTHDILQSSSARYGSKTAVAFESDALSYDDLLAEAEGFAGGLSAIGVKSNDPVASLMDNSLNAIRAWLGVAVHGAMDVPINPQYRGDLLAYLLSDSGAGVVICDDTYLSDLLEISERLPNLRTIVVSGSFPIDAPARPRIISFDVVRGGIFADSSVGQSDERVILYTSGTTGPSKGVIHTQSSCLTLAQYNAKCLNYGQDDRLLNFFPLYHQNARYTGVLPAIVSGSTIRVQRKFSSSTFWRLVADEGITAFNYLGSLLRLVLNVTPQERGPDSHTLRKAFGAGATPSVWVECEERLGIRLVETYGLSEAPMATVNIRTESGDIPAGSAGNASDLFEVAVLDKDDNPVPANVIGEIAMRPKRADALMQGYLNKDGSTVSAFRNLWFHSGDRGRLSEEGYLFFEARDKDSIRRRGENISAWEVESILDKHPDVAESAVYGLPSEEADEEVAAALVWKHGEGDIAGLLAFARANLPAYAVPVWLRVLNDLPRTSTEKVQKAELKKAGRSGCVPSADY